MDNKAKNELILYHALDANQGSASISRGSSNVMPNEFIPNDETDFAQKC
mgnify:CR=1 FL=1|jgi:hypothetical protein